MAGRDIGTVVLPDADLKLFLDASARGAGPAAGRGARPRGRRAARRTRSSRSSVAATSSTRHGPSRRSGAAADAVHLQTDGNALETTVGLVVDAIRRREAELARPARPACRGPRAARSAKPDPDRHAVDRRHHGRLVRHARPRAAVHARPDRGRRGRDPASRCRHRRRQPRLECGPGPHRRVPQPAHRAADNWLGKREVFDVPGLSWLARHGGVHPVERGAADIEAFKSAMRILEAGHILAVFPEGTRSPDGRLQAAKDGVAVLASRSGATVVPIGVGDSDRLWPQGRAPPALHAVGHRADRRAVPPRRGARDRRSGRGPRPAAREGGRDAADHAPDRRAPAAAPARRLRGPAAGLTAARRDPQPRAILRGSMGTVTDIRIAQAHRLLLRRSRGHRQGQGVERRRQGDAHPGPGRPQRGRRPRPPGARASGPSTRSTTSTTARPS